MTLKTKQLKNEQKTVGVINKSNIHLSEICDNIHVQYTVCNIHTHYTVILQYIEAYIIIKLTL